MAIPDWPELERPREKLLKQGAKSLSDAELLAIFLRTGIAGKSAVDLARESLKHFGSLTALFLADQHAFCQLPGMGLAKYTQLQAVLEMAQRALKEEMKSRDVMDSPQSVRNYLYLNLVGKEREVFVGIFLDARNRIIAAEELFVGTLTQASVYPREVVKRALHHNAAAMIFAHNHPSGIAEPSKADEILTQSLKQALALVDIKVLDHFIIGEGDTLSFAERGLI
ncbi:DNA replication and repair protein RadC [Nitrosomonas nitrosa]|jgi:DNA repair protein RadC|uniref:DNA replication and repair protein RadC n=1 Tax=Nitrosomonas nitrosa TaxID=52442 RepID=A0A1I4T1S2_9PROT|nr:MULTISPECIES: DNA repair protein RadC [Nitrosomonas]MCO6433710.1 DNA repair protein RadC [Nitrosomonas nitrosa]MCW5598435.1 DNA repair protein RadC [Nitrosomonas sp.]MCW5600935.1 DNA repair protein RadC [Nitrosomonas sp.]PTQ92488.1 DNA replication and repair protein RadC [Nitrosomonas nitrosa]CAE6516602.1 protein associated with replication fork, possible DNA repair protein [Nitrosomonas nitrosa]